LELGRFESLPADVFVRGFLRSYASCVGLDADDTLRRYGRLGFDAAPVASEEAEELLAQLRSDGAPAEPTPKRRLARGSSHESDTDESRPTFRATEWLAKVKESVSTRERRPEKPTTKSKAHVEPIERDHRAKPKAHRPSTPRPRVFFPNDFAGQQDSEGKRGNLTFAVIVLVIVATITMSYLMRKPGHGGDGISAIPAETSTELV